MDNIEYTIENDILTVKVDLRKRLGASQTGKSQIVASTRGNVSLTPTIRMGMTIFVKEEAKA